MVLCASEAKAQISVEQAKKICKANSETIRPTVFKKRKKIDQAEQTINFFSFKKMEGTL